MSDTTTISPPDTAPQSAPQAEVPINPNPVDQPNPIGSQAPDKPAEDRVLSRREAIQKAFDRANNPAQAKAKAETKPANPAKPADAKMGHNQPPEATEKLDLKKRPTPDQPRSEKGTFAPRQSAEVKDEVRSGLVNSGQQDTSATQSANAQIPHLPDHAPYREPPPRFSDQGKAAWAAAPESVRGDVYRMHREYQGAYEQYKSAHEAFQPVARFHQMAQQHGTTLEKALDNFVGIEAKLRTDPVAGLDQIVYNLGLTDPETGRRINLRDISYHVLSQSPEQLQQVQQGNAQSAASQQIGALHREVAGLKDTLQQWQNAQQYSYTLSQVDQFAVNHPRVDELSEVIKREIDLGFDLDTAYRRAELLQPATHAAQTRPTASAQTRNIDRSISGSPEAGPSNGTSRPKGPPPGRREAIQNAIRRVNGSM